MATSEHYCHSSFERLQMDVSGQPLHVADRENKTGFKMEAIGSNTLNHRS